MLLTKGESKGVLLEDDYIDDICYELYKNFGVCKSRSSLASGYVRKGYIYLALYNGRFGVGVTVRYRNSNSTRFCYKETYIYEGVTVEEMEEALERVYKRYGIEVKH